MKRLPHLPLSTRRIIAAAALFLCALCVANYYFDLKLLWGFDKNAMKISFVILGLSQILFGASVEELRRYRDSKRRQEQ